MRARAAEWWHLETLAPASVAALGIEAEKAPVERKAGAEQSGWETQRGADLPPKLAREQWLELNHGHLTC